MKRVKLSLRERLHCLKNSIEELRTVYVLTYDDELKRWYWERTTLWERLCCAFAMLEIAITGVLYELEEVR